MVLGTPVPLFLTLPQNLCSAQTGKLTMHSNIYTESKNLCENDIREHKIIQIEKKLSDKTKIIAKSDIMEY